MIDRTIATTAWNQLGLGTLGAASGRVATRWAEGDPTYDATAMTLTLTGATRWIAPVAGTFGWRAFGAPELRDADGVSLDGVVGVLRLHPHGALRLRRLAARRHDGRTDGRAIRPMPFFLAIRDGTPPAEVGSMIPSDPPLAPNDAPVGTPLSTGRLTVHDATGGCIDPVAVAAILRDLLRGFPTLRDPDAGPVSDLESTGTAGGLGRIANLGTGRRVQLVTVFGRPWGNLGPVGVRIGTGPRLEGGPHDWATGTLQASATDAGTLRFGFTPEGTLGTAAVSAPTPPTAVFPAGSPAVELGREYLRVAVVDLGQHLRGNRTTAEVDGVAAADSIVAIEPAPPVFDGDTLEVLVDGTATTGAITELAATGFVLAVSPTIGADAAFPPTRTSRWPAFPAPIATAEDLDGARSTAARTTATAAYVGDTVDVAVTFPAGALPAEAHVRVFPRVDPGPVVVELRLIDFSRRGDGGAAVVDATGAAAMVIRDPFAVGSGVRPDAPFLRFDLLIVTRGPSGAKRRLFGGLETVVGTGGTAIPATPSPLAAIPVERRGISPAPVLGLPPTAPAAFVDQVLDAAALSHPRESPRWPTMARTESLVAAHDGTSWTAVATAGILDARSVRGDARDGAPGLPAGPEEHAPGLRVTGRLAQGLARAALRRTHHLQDRLPELDEARWATPTAGTGTTAAAVLGNVAPTVDAPELTVVPTTVIDQLPADWTAIVAAIADLLPSALGSVLRSTPAPGAADRWADETLREAFSAAHGRRDTQWAFRWALSHARELVYLETALLGAPGSGDIDWVGLLADRLRAEPALNVILALPKRIPFGPGYESFAQRFHVSRNAAVDALTAAGPGRVAVFHPIGFPGRPEALRGTVAVVDDVWALVGGSTVSRRGFTFDGSTDVAFLDRTVRDGASVGVRELRRRSMARLLGVAPPATADRGPGVGPDRKSVV